MTLNTGDNVLFVAPASVDQSLYIQTQKAVQEQVGSSGKAAFELIDRVSEGIDNNSLYTSI